METACPAIGYSSVATVTLEQPREGLTLRLCDGADCEPGPANDDVIAIEGDSLHGWTADFIGGQDTIGYRLTDTTGTTVAEGSIEVEWIRVGGTAECGGPTEATIELPTLRSASSALAPRRGAS